MPGSPVPPNSSPSRASHDGSPVHLEIVRSILADAGLDDSALGNTPDWPLDDASAEAVIAAGGHRTALYMNCSGKHAAMVATCLLNDWPTEGYLHPDHPLQQLITHRVEQLMGSVSHIGIDGCGAGHVVELSRLARAYAAPRPRPRRGVGRDAPVPRTRRRARAGVGPARRSGPRRDGQGRRRGVFAAGLPDGTAVAVKIADGSACRRCRRGGGARGGRDRRRRDGDRRPDQGHGRAVGQLRPLVGSV
ncbi:MAG: asparaginase [Ilumatobacteraceae bacterium]